VRAKFPKPHLSQGACLHLESLSRRPPKFLGTPSRAGRPTTGSSRLWVAVGIVERVAETDPHLRAGRARLEAAASCRSWQRARRSGTPLRSASVLIGCFAAAVVLRAPDRRHRVRCSGNLRRLRRDHGDAYRDGEFERRRPENLACRPARPDRRSRFQSDQLTACVGTSPTTLFPPHRDSGRYKVSARRHGRVYNGRCREQTGGMVEGGRGVATDGETVAVDGASWPMPWAAVRCEIGSVSICRSERFRPRIAGIAAGVVIGDRDRDRRLRLDRHPSDVLSPTACLRSWRPLERAGTYQRARRPRRRQTTPARPNSRTWPPR
jgi:hypothetical protein